ncbi:N-acyl-L-amino acid amidohydrolase [Sporosarcina sp. NCCP-2716]|uniref:M20 metallopeptidase family protein n=1 Tax=Sporosarcina sp. NCCP-2716 TaxID=2943679 RepID=UPI00203A7C89|nr:amidohydrolase [Sporosarcina sp. NCCP-2716]GKV69206.1 N-acyl-L-amino acid amidohydrolase [Sporosarcina sp. NCCP-2716]
MTLQQETAEWVVQQRRYLHAHPELSHQETETKEYVKQQLEIMGLETYSMTGKDIIGVLRGDRAGKTIAIRSDMDALPILEQTGLPFASKNENVMHACGHDGHMAILLGVARLLADRSSDIAGTLLFVFQHAEEELPGGATELVEAGLLDGIDAIFGYHLWQPIPAGVIGVREGPTMAGADRFSFTIQGKGGHGSMPQDTIDPTLVMSAVILQIQSIISRSLSPSEEAVLSIGELRSGSNYNIIPDSAYASGTVRYFHKEASEHIKKRLHAIIDGVCQAYGATFELDYQHGDPPLDNDPQLTAFMERQAKQLVEEKQVTRIDGIMGSEDFAYYSTEIPASYIFLGIGHEDRPYGHHHPKFDIDESVLATGVELFTESLLTYMEENR